MRVLVLSLCLFSFGAYAQEPLSEPASQPASAPTTPAATQPESLSKDKELLQQLLTPEEAQNPTSANIETKPAEVKLPSKTYDRSLLLSFVLSTGATAAGYGLLTLSVTQKIDEGANTLSAGLALDPLSGAGYGLALLGPSLGHLYAGRKVHTFFFTSLRVAAGAGVFLGAKAIDNHCVEIGGCQTPLDFLPQAGMTVLSLGVLEGLTVVDVLGSFFAPVWRKRLLERRDNKKVIMFSPLVSVP